MSIQNITSSGWSAIVSKGRSSSLSETSEQETEEKGAPLQVRRISTSISAELDAIDAVLAIRDPQKQTDSICKSLLGASITRCAKAAEGSRELSSRVKTQAVRMLQSLAAYYFYHTELWVGARKSILLSDSEKAKRSAVELGSRIAKMTVEDVGSFSWIAARDLATGRLCLSRSGRPWGATRVSMERWEKSKAEWNEVLQGEKLMFGSILWSPATFEILTSLSEIYVECCRIYKDSDAVSHFTDFNKIRGDFCGLIVKLCSTRPPRERGVIVQLLEKHFPTALTARKWSALYKVMNKPQIEQRDILSIVCETRTTPNEAVAMSMATLFCGEPKIALDFCRELGTLDPKIAAKLPATLGERLEISAYPALPDKSGAKDPIPICSKCYQVWPIAESLYWAIRQSGLSLAAIESL